MPSILFCGRMDSMQCHLVINVYVEQVCYAYISAPGICICFQMGSMNGFIVDSRRYLFWLHIINQYENALLASQSEEVTLTSHFRAVDTPNEPYQPLIGQC